MKQRTHQLKSYVEYRKKAKGRHGTHSPFVYDFIERILRSKEQLPIYMKEIRTAIHNDNQTIEVEDLGAGSHSSNSEMRRVKDIANTALMPMAWQQVLVRMAQCYKPTTVLELGTSLGATSIALSKTLPQSKIVSVEGSREISVFAQHLAKKHHAENLSIINASFDAFIEQNTAVYDWVLLDGNHTYEATVRYYQYFVKMAKPGSMLLLDDIYWSEGMTKAWEEVKEDRRSVLTLDLYRWGLVFFPENTSKQHFIVRSGISPLSK